MLILYKNDSNVRFVLFRKNPIAVHAIEAFSINRKMENVVNVGIKGLYSSITEDHWHVLVRGSLN